ncbi:MAG: HEAT repeat domain-containing protein [Phycisphaerales bacterium]|nr:MAG: HEAT repeat domain-containing protein [Phycisphaerales bacterium]
MLKTRIHLVLAGVLLVAAALSLGQTVPPATKESETKLINVLKSDASHKEKADACRQLAIIGSKDAVAPLAALLDDDKLAHMARYALEPIADPAVDAALRNALGRLKGLHLVGVIGSVGVRRDAAAVEQLAGMLLDSDAEVACAAARSLGSIGTSDAAAALQKVLPGVPDENQLDFCEGLLRCAEALAVEGDKQGAIAIYDRLRTIKAPHQVRGGALRGAILTRGGAGVTLLREHLRSDDYILFSAATQTALEMPGSDVTRALTGELGGLSGDNKIMVVQTLGYRGDAGANPSLAAAAERGPKAVRLAAIRAMTEIGHISAMPALVKLLDDGDGDISRTATECLAALPGERVDAGILAMLKSTDIGAQLTALDLVGRRRMTSSVPALLVLARNSQGQVRTGALRKVGELGAADDLGALLVLMLDLRESRDLDAARQALTALCGKAGDPDLCTEKLADLLGRAKPEQKVALLRVLGGIGDAKSFEAVRGALDDKEPDVQDAAVRALANWPDATATQVLLDIFTSTQNRTHRALALRGATRLLGLGSWSPGDTLNVCRRLMSAAASPGEKRLVLGCLAKVPDMGAIDVVEPLLSDSEVGAEAELAMLGVARSTMGSDRDQAKRVTERMLKESGNRGVRRQASELMAEIDKLEDYVASWQVAGPYTRGRNFRALLRTAFDPEKDDPAVAWKTLRIGGSADRPWMFNLGAALGGGNARAAYVRTWVHSDRRRPVRIEFGTDDGNKLWLNGKVLSQDGAGGSAVPGEHKVEAILNEGPNALLLKVTQDSGPWEFCLRICNRDGSRLEGVTAKAWPPN